MSKKTIDPKANLEKWKSLTEPSAVSVKSLTGKLSTGQVYIFYWDKKQRLSRAIKGLGFCIIGILVGAILPVVGHFMILPASIIASPIVFFYLLRQKSVVLGGISNCPDCSAVLEITKSAEKWPIKDVCAGCGQHVSVQLIPH